MMNVAKRATAISAAVVFLVVIIVLIVLGITKHTEAGVLTAAVSPAGEVTYACTLGTPGCHELYFARRDLPMSVRADADASKAQQKAVTETIASVNEELGFTAFRYAPDALDTFLLVDFIPASSLWGNSGLDNEEQAITHHDLAQDGRITGTWILVNKEQDTNMFVYELRHEFGHALGLAHDDYAASVMCNPPGAAGRFSSSDKKLLRKMAGK